MVSDAGRTDALVELREQQEQQLVAYFRECGIEDRDAILLLLRSAAAHHHDSPAWPANVIPLRCSARYCSNAGQRQEARCAGCYWA